MAIEHPVAVFVAETNIEAHVIAILLNDFGVEAHAVEDVSPAGMYSLGTLDEIHRPKVFVSPENLDVAQGVIARYQANALAAGDTQQPPCCYFCGAPCDANAVKCAACGQNLEWDDSERAAVSVSQAWAKPAGLDALRSLKPLAAIVLLTPLVTCLGLVLLAVVMKFIAGLGK